MSATRTKEATHLAMVDDVMMIWSFEHVQECEHAKIKFSPGKKKWYGQYRSNHTGSTAPDFQLLLLAQPYTYLGVMWTQDISLNCITLIVHAKG